MTRPFMKLPWESASLLHCGVVVKNANSGAKLSPAVGLWACYLASLCPSTNLAVVRQY